jgi:hypothetical protein
MSDSHAHDIREWDGESWHFMDGRPYRRAKTSGELTAVLAEQHALVSTELPIADAVAVLKRVKRIE